MLLFPGQGSQFVGMGQDLLQYPNVPEMYALASEILGKLKSETEINIRNFQTMFSRLRFAEVMFGRTTVGTR